MTMPRRIALFVLTASVAALAVGQFTFAGLDRAGAGQREAAAILYAQELANGLAQVCADPSVAIRFGDLCEQAETAVGRDPPGAPTPRPTGQSAEPAPGPAEQSFTPAPQPPVDPPTVLDPKPPVDNPIPVPTSKPPVEEPIPTPTPSPTGPVCLFRLPLSGHWICLE